MTYAEKRVFVDELISRVQAEIVAKIPKMPDEWDGHELRRYIADQFEDCARMSQCSPGNDRKRRSYYTNNVLVNNL